MDTLTLWIGCFIVAWIIPAAVIAVRHSVRLRRLRELGDFDDAYIAPGADGHVDHTMAYAKRKYTADLDSPPPGSPAAQRFETFDFTDSVIADHYEDIGWFGLRCDRRLLANALPFVLVVSFGLLLAVVRLCGTPDLPWFCTALFGAGAADPATIGPLASTVAAIGFLGGVLFSLRLLLRSICAYDLTSVTFYHAAFNLMLSMTVTTVAFRAFPGLGTETATPGADPTLTAYWIAIAFVLGYVPDAGLSLVLDRVGQTVKVFKTADNSFAGAVRSLPLDLLDGVDFYTSFRLEQAAITEVQNLAVANPVLLCVETPFPIMQVLDWAGQAQLCDAVGPERFLILRNYGVRTIFDLEQAVLPASAGDSRLGQIIGGILLRTPASVAAIPEVGTARKFAQIDGATATERLDLAGFDAWVSGLVKDHGMDTVRHLVRMLLDNPPVQRLRAVRAAVALNGQAGGGMAPPDEPVDETG